MATAPANNSAIGIANPAAATAAIEIAKSFLTALEKGDLDGAASFLAPQPVFIFTGGARRQNLAEIVKGLTVRYQFVGKHFDGFDAAPAEGGFVVYVRGTLHGRWSDGSPFEGIRFIDRFEIRDGKIHRQDVWNDAAETLSRLRATAP
jgi:ketosteroid isomerase-like protein